MSLNQVYHYDGVTKTAITASVIKLSATQGVYPDFGGMEVVLSYPVLDANGSEVTLEKGDLIWCNVRYASTMMFAPGLGEISDIKRSGDFITVKVESMLEPLMRMRYAIDNGVSGFVSDRIWDVITKHTPPHGITVSSQFLIYRRQTGAETWNLDTTMSKVVHGLEVDVRAYFQYLIEQPINLWLEKPTGTIYPVYDYYDHWSLPTFKVGYTGYGNHRQADLTLTRDNGILSEIEWEEPTESVLNDVTITVRGGGSEQFTDAASIAAYGKRQTTLLRGIYTEDAVGGYDATLSIKSIVKSMAVPHKRCRLTCEATAIFNDWQTVGGIYRVIDDATGQDEYMALRSFTYKFPEEVCECEFDNAPLDMSKYGLRMENRVTSLEANQVTAHAGFFDLQGGVSPNQYYHLSQAAYNNLYQQDQGVKTTDSPTFALLNISSPSGTAMFGPANTSFCHIYTDRPAFIFDKSITCNPSSGLDLGQSNRYWRSLYMNGNLVMNGTTFVDASRNVVANTLAVIGGSSTSDMGVLQHTGATASDNVTLGLKRTNQTGTQLYLDLWDATNNKRGGINVGAVRINNGTVAIDANNDHMARNISASGGRMDLSGAAPLFYWAETDQTLPAGRWRMGVDGDALLIDHNTASDGLYGTRQRSYFNSNGFTCHGSITAGFVRAQALSVPLVSASDTVQAEKLATAYNNTSTYVKLLTIRSRRTIVGTIRVKYTQDSVTGTGSAYARFYINGVGVGTEYGTTSTDDVARSEDISVAVKPGDTLEVWAMTSGTRVSYVKNLRICFTDGAAPTTDFDAL